MEKQGIIRETATSDIVRRMQTYNSKLISNNICIILLGFVIVMFLLFEQKHEEHTGSRGEVDENPPSPKMAGKVRRLQEEGASASQPQQDTPLVTRANCKSTPTACQPQSHIPPIKNSGPPVLTRPKSKLLHNIVKKSQTEKKKIHFYGKWWGNQVRSC